MDCNFFRSALTTESKSSARDLVFKTLYFVYIVSRGFMRWLVYYFAWVYLFGDLLGELDVYFIYLVGGFKSDFLSDYWIHSRISESSPLAFY